ncbi:MAG: transposase [Bdellovibrio sp.]
MDRVWEIFCEELISTSQKHRLQIHSFILMSNHFHLIASTPDSNISRCMHQFMYRSSRRLTREGNRINETFAGRHYKCILQHHNYYLNAYKYNYRNPIAAGICDKVEDYQFSTLYGLAKNKEKVFPLLEDTTFHCDPTGTLKWLNTKPDEIKLEGVRYGLKHQFFKSKKNCKDNKPIISDFELI